MAKQNEMLISVDVETTGPIPGKYSMDQLGACVVYKPVEFFEANIKLLNDNFDAEFLKARGLTIEEIKSRPARDPSAVMANFAGWLDRVSEHHRATPVFLGFAAPFDWSFVNYYLHTFNGVNPFGIRCIDIKAYYQGIVGCAWSETSKQKIKKWLGLKIPHAHQALDDALEQAVIYRAIQENRALLWRP